MQSDRLVYGAISGMLQTLDPHSSFMDPKSYAQMRERQEGRYYGLGISISASSTAKSPSVNVFEGSPAYQKGMRRGDVIAKIEGEDTKGWTSEQAVRKLRGAEGTAGRHLDAAQRLRQADRRWRSTRDEIHMPTVPAAFMIDATTGYMRLTEFGENTDQELGARSRT